MDKISEELKQILENPTEYSIGESAYREQSEAAYKYALEMTLRELKQAVEGMYHNLNTLQSRSGNQLPFSSINYGTCTLPEGRMVIKALLEGCIAGVGKVHRTSIFPCGIFQCKTGVNRKPGDPNYDLFKLALESTTKRLYPNYANCDVSQQIDAQETDIKLRQQVIQTLSSKDYNALKSKLQENPELGDILGVFLEDDIIKVSEITDFRTIMSTMGCRTCQFTDINFDETYRHNIDKVISGEVAKPSQIMLISSNQKDARGNICPVTIILPTLAMEAGRDVECFMSLLDTKIHEARDMLIERFNFICSQDAASAKFMYENHLVAEYIPEEGIKSALRHGTLGIGQLGLAETLQLLLGKNHITEEGMELAKRIEGLFKQRCAEFKNKYKLNFGVYYTPAESLCHTAMQRFKDKYGVIENVSDREYFTNSIHVPVWENVDMFTKIDIESQLTGYSSAGCITYVEIDSSVQENIEAIESVVSYAMDNDIPYFAINVPNDTCLDCGYTDEFNDCCPVCNSKHIQQLRRVTGYLTGNFLTAFNKGKVAEVKDRVKHKVR